MSWVCVWDEITQSIDLLSLNRETEQPMSELEHALDGAQLVKTYHNGFNDVVMVWHGGTTINIYTVDHEGTWDSVDVFSLSNDEGEPCEREEVREHMENHAEYDGLAE